MSHLRVSRKVRFTLIVTSVTARLNGVKGLSLLPAGMSTRVSTRTGVPRVVRGEVPIDHCAGTIPLLAGYTPPLSFSSCFSLPEPSFSSCFSLPGPSSSLPGDPLGPSSSLPGDPLGPPLLTRDISSRASSSNPGYPSQDQEYYSRTRSITPGPGGLFL